MELDSTCLTCRWWWHPRARAGEPGATVLEGSCRRRAPVYGPPMRTDGPPTPGSPYAPMALFPPTMADDWCGDWDHDRPAQPTPARVLDKDL